MAHVLDEREGWLFVKETTIDLFEPRHIINWWPLGRRYSDFEQWFASPERARAALDKPLHTASNSTYQDERGWTYRLKDGGQTKPEHTDLVPIPEPKQRGRKYPMEWRRGEWYKFTPRGSVGA